MVMAIIQDQQEVVYLSLNNALLQHNGTVRNVHLLEAYVLKELMLRVINVSHIRHAKMDLFGIQFI